MFTTRMTRVAALAAVALGVLLPSPAGGSPAAAGDPAPRSAGTSGWSRPVPLGYARGDSDVSAVAAAEGDLTVVWDARGLVSRTKQHGGAWGPVLRVGNWDWTQLGVDADGDVTAIGRGGSRGGFSVVTATKPDGGTWTATRRLSHPTSRRGCHVYPGDVGFDVSASGAAVVAWEMSSEHCRMGDRAVVSYRTPSGSWSRPTRLAHPARVGGVAFDAAQVPTVLLRVPERHAYGARLVAMRRTGGAWHRYGGVIARHVGESVIASGPGGHTVVAWIRGRNRGGDAVYASRWTAGHWTRAVRLSGLPKGSRDIGSIGVDGEGTATVLWFSGRDTRVVGWHVGRSPGRPHLINKTGGGELRVAPSGLAVVAWPRSVRRPGMNDIAVTTRPPGGRWSAPRVIGRRGSWDVALDVWPGGDVVAIWADADCCGHRIRASFRR